MTHRITSRLGSVGLFALVWVLVGMTGVGDAPTDSPVADAAMRGDTEAVRALVNGQGADVNAAQGDGMTALHWAAANGNPELVQVLIEVGANLELTTRIGAYTPLHLASKEGNAEAIRYLLNAGADPAARTASGGATALHFAASADSPEGVALLIDSGADPNVGEDQWGQTPLIFAASANRTRAVEALLERGADPAHMTRAVNVSQLSEVHSAAREAWSETLEGFREEELGTDEMSEEEEEEATRAWQPTPKQLALAAEAAREVLRTRSPEDVELEEPEPGTTSQNEMVGGWGGLTALLHAVRQGHIATAKALIAGGADINQVSGGDQTSPLLMAAVNGQFDMALVLLDYGADPNLASEAGTTPLYAALERQWAPRSRFPQVREHEYQDASHLDVLRALLEAGAEPNVRLNSHLWYMAHVSCGNANCGLERVWGATPFWRAAYALDVEAMKILAEFGADPHIPTRRPQHRGGNPYGDGEEEEEKLDPSGMRPIPTGGPGVYPIHAASGVGYGEGFGANAHRYAPTGFLPAIRYLVEEVGVDVNQRDYNGYTPLHHAAARGDNEAILYLVEHGADVTVLSRSGQTTADMANGPVQRISPYPATVRLLESLGSHNNDNCVSC